MCGPRRRTARLTPGEDGGYGLVFQENLCLVLRVSGCDAQEVTRNTVLQKCLLPFRQRTSSKDYRTLPAILYAARRRDEGITQTYIYIYHVASESSIPSPAGFRLLQTFVASLSPPLVASLGRLRWVLA
jgi:hypothetical protein